MTTLLVMLDTNIVSDLMRNPSGRVAENIERIGVDSICISVLSAAELRYGGLRKGSARLAAEIEGVLLRLRVLSFEPPSDRSYATIRHSLSKAGTPIGPMDYLIAAHALSLDLTLVTANIGEFSRVPGLKVENWLD